MEITQMRVDVGLNYHCFQLVIQTKRYDLNNMN